MDKIEIPGYPGYFINSKAQIFGKRGKILKGWIWQHQNTERRRVTLINEQGVRKTVSVSRLMGIVFVSNPDNKPEINHKDCNTLNDLPENLEWVTRLENIQHARDNNLFRNHVPIRAINKITNKEHKFSSIAECRRFLGINRSCRIHQAIKYPNRTVKGYYIKK